MGDRNRVGGIQLRMDSDTYCHDFKTGSGIYPEKHQDK